MNVLGVGPLELLVVLVIAFLVLGPDRMSSTARSLGKIVRDLRQQASGLPRSLDEFLEQPEEEPTPQAKEAKPPGVPRPKRRRSADDEAQDTSADNPTSEE